MPVQYCHDCNNILYPKYESNTFALSCKKCNTTVDLRTNVVYTREKREKAENKNRQYFLNDVTLPQLDRICIKCENNKCVYYMRKSDIKALDTYYICMSCMYEWTDATAGAQ